MPNSIPLEQVSVLIVTHERSALLAQLLDSLEQVGGSRWARIVVEDDSTHPLVTAPRYSALPLLHRISPERLYISRAKNLGLREINSPFVLIIDDDNTLTEATLTGLGAQFSEDPRIGAVMPSVLYRSQPELVWVYATPFRPDRWAFDLLGRDRPRDPSLEGRALPTDALPNAALFRTEALRSVNGYDERYEINSSADLCRRLKARGWKVYAYSGSFVLHDVEPPGRAGYWAAHAVVDPERVYHEARDWARFQVLGARRRVMDHGPSLAPRVELGRPPPAGPRRSKGRRPADGPSRRWGSVSGTACAPNASSRGPRIGAHHGSISLLAARDQDFAVDSAERGASDLATRDPRSPRATGRVAEVRIGGRLRWYVARASVAEIRRRLQNWLALPRSTVTEGHQRSRAARPRGPLGIAEGARSTAVFQPGRFKYGVCVRALGAFEWIHDS